MKKHSRLKIASGKEKNQLEIEPFQAEKRSVGYHWEQRWSFRGFYYCYLHKPPTEHVSRSGHNLAEIGRLSKRKNALT